jgi:hypothetical protein
MIYRFRYSPPTVHGTRNNLAWGWEVTIERIVTEKKIIATYFCIVGKDKVGANYCIVTGDRIGAIAAVQHTAEVRDETR